MTLLGLRYIIFFYSDGPCSVVSGRRPRQGIHLPGLALSGRAGQTGQHHTATSHGDRRPRTDVCDGEHGESRLRASPQRFKGRVAVLKKTEITTFMTLGKKKWCMRINVHMHDRHWPIWEVTKLIDLPFKDLELMISDEYLIASNLLACNEQLSYVMKTQKITN